MPDKGVSIMAVQEISKCTERCLKCKHHTRVTSLIMNDGTIACAYILDKFKRRGCPAGDKCTKFNEGATTKRFKQKDIRRK